MNTPLEHPTRRTATCAEREAWANALLVAHDEISRAGGLDPEATPPGKEPVNPTSRSVQRPSAGKSSAQENQRPGAADDDHTREAAPVSRTSSAPPSSGAEHCPVIELCMTCEFVKEADATWRALTPAEVSVVECGLVQVSHGCCPACAAAFRNLLLAEKQKHDAAQKLIHA